MKSGRVLEALGDIDAKFIEEAWCFRHKKLWRCLVPVAASLVLITAFLFIFSKGLLAPPALPGLENGMEAEGIAGEAPEGPLTPGCLPLLQLDFEVGGMGFEGYMAYGIEDLVSNNPWHENMELSTLPVYEGPGYWSAEQQTGIDFERMEAWALKIADRLGAAKEDLIVGDNRPTAQDMAAITEKYAAIGEEVPPQEFFAPTEVVVTGNGLKITVDARFEAAIFFNPGRPLPPEYNFTHHAGYEDILKVAQYLRERYGSLLALTMKEPVINIGGGDYDIYDRQAYRIEYYEGAGNITEQIIAYNLGAVNLFCDDNGMLYGARLFLELPTHKLGDYPIITAAQAEELLGQGQFITTVPADFPGLEYVCRVELIYRRGWEATLLPYYRFYVEIPEMVCEGRKTKTYGAYYVPAVESRYIKNLSPWDGSFN